MAQVTNFSWKGVALVSDKCGFDLSSGVLDLTLGTLLTSLSSFDLSVKREFYLPCWVFVSCE